ncbi:predicted protein [Naegleria gruberi]|uniref:Predicted protein n=1 Tax=Naegleria gruberi TaxID=5762 RepID=D2VT40_NAEGR|nr:uncharacterized protein NAEGRDRAFT_72164 [Naegleria gruberi]EFC40016.1 predicted protein [Naegleria gruberi]|eukprot:XP_002672760.1 predicted protein [Naegleria gruberi strain NEG-M]
MFLAVMILLSISIAIEGDTSVHDNKEIVFYPLRTHQQFDIQNIPTYFLESAYFKAYFELYYSEDDFDLIGTHQFLSEQTQVSEYPSIIKKNKLLFQYGLTWDLTKAHMKPNTQKNQTVTLKFYPQFKYNIDPYSVRAFLIKQSENLGIQTQFTPLFPASDVESPTLGPWECTLSLRNYNFDLPLQLTIFAYSAASIGYVPGEVVPIYYPRGVSFFMKGTSNLRLDVMYANATVIDPYERERAPTLSVSSYRKTVNAPSGYLVFTQFFVKEDSNNILDMEETRLFTFNSALYVGSFTIDPFSLKCAYATKDSNFQTLVIDPTSSVTIGCLFTHL